MLREVPEHQFVLLAYGPLLTPAHLWHRGGGGTAEGPSIWHEDTWKQGRISANYLTNQIKTQGESNFLSS